MTAMDSLLFITWNPDLFAFHLGSFGVRWYSLCWCFALLAAYVLVQRLYRRQHIADKLFDGLGACLGSCPRGALSLELREAAPFEDPAASVCPSARPASGEAAARGAWPIKLALVPPDAPFLQGADIFLTADCAPGACTSFHARRGGSGPLLLCCPRLEDRQTMTQRLAALIRAANPASFIITRMEVPCCGIPELLAAARREAGSDIPVSVVMLDRSGNEIRALQPLRDKPASDI